MPALIAVDMPGGPGFVEAVERTWQAGDAFVPIDQRLPLRARRRLLDQVRPAAVIDGSGTLIALPDPGPPVDDGDALVVATSGTTGTPKLVVHTGSALEAHALAVHDRLGVDPDRDRWLACLPLSHVGGLGVVLRSVLTDTAVDVMSAFDAAVVARAPVDLGTTLVSLVPTALDRIDHSAFRWVVLGGSSDGATRRGNVVRTYGLTETGGGVVYDGVPLAGVEIRVGADGSIEVRGPSLARGLRQPDGTLAPLTDADGWLRTGDVGSMSDAGVLTVHGRADDMINTGGENVWPEPVETALLAHPEVAEAVVVGRPDPTWGQRVVAVVVPADPTRPPSLDQLRGQVREWLPAHCAPKELEVVTSIPRTPLGKPRRRALREPAAGPPPEPDT